jgi:hypothetical protein
MNVWLGRVKPSWDYVSGLTVFTLPLSHDWGMGKLPAPPLSLIWRA